VATDEKAAANLWTHPSDKHSFTVDLFPSEVRDLRAIDWEMRTECYNSVSTHVEERAPTFEQGSDRKRVRMGACQTKLDFCSRGRGHAT